MSDPGTLALIAGGISAAGSIAQGRAQARAASFQAASFRQQAERERQVAAAKAAALRRQRSRESSRLRARLLASGVDVSSGSPLLGLETIAGDSELEALTAINQGAFNAGQLEGKGNLANFRGKEARRQGFFNATTTLLNAAK